MIRTTNKSVLILGLIALFLPSTSISETQPPDLRDSVATAQGALTQSGWPRSNPRERGRVLSASNDPLWKVAGRACAGKLDRSVELLEAVRLDGPVFFYREQPQPEILMIPTGYCPTPSEIPNTVFLIGRFQRAKSYFFKISPQGEGIIEAAESYYDSSVGDVVYKRLAPIRREGGRNVYAENVESEFKDVLSTTIARWGHFAPVVSSNR